MTFGGPVFFGFLALTWLAHRLSPARWRMAVLLIASITFYTAASAPHAVTLVALTAFVWWVGNRIALAQTPPQAGRTGSARLWTALGIAAIVATLAAFKYLGMMVGTLDAMTGRAFSLPVPRVVPPLGISFVSFMLISYLIEVYRGTPRASAAELMTFSTFFPTVVSGPIKRWTPFREQLAAAAPASPVDLSTGLARIVIGLFKKVVIADTIALSLGPIADPSHTQPITMLVTVYLLALRIYFDFAGYSDMAIGIARLFGFTIPENFSHPYLRRNLSEFWRHWHMTLTRFLTEYVYFPLGGSRRGEVRTALNTMVIMAISGIWHGAAWHFVAWGLYHGAGLVVLRWFRKAVAVIRFRVASLDRIASSRPGSWLGYAAGTVFTFHFVALGWVLFSAPLGRSLQIYAILGQGVVRVLAHVARLVS